MPGQMNSIYAPIPLSVENGGTGNSTALIDNQIWVGNTGGIPDILTLTGGGNNRITNGSGTTGNLTISDKPIPTTAAPFVTTLAPFVDYWASPPTPFIYQLPSSVTPGDVFSMMNASGAQRIELSLFSGQIIHYLTNTFTSQITIPRGGSITLECVANSPTLFLVKNSNNAVFTGF